ncbi:type II and III secretion system protein family protein [Methylobrevis albus]|uniref:Type II and III secretion system protein family protein n=1 Tax=Methylobrevis albus TaxID=2793297 RepID=A0A931I403_9HYPH|nr:type II and III secretion system protein family protein [Methylobrevis albus]MBH0238453.1 type II and III secretion system protein family protein [Methylobrevis albus]
MKSKLKNLLAALLTAAVLAAPPAGLAPMSLVTSAAAADAAYLRVGSAAELSGRQIALGVSKSMVIDVPEDIVDVLISNPGIADAIVRTKRKIYLIGNAVGETNVILFGAGNEQFAQFEIVVARPTGSIAATIQQLLPGSNIRVETVNDSVIVSGTAQTPADAGKAAEIAAKFIGDPAKVVNMITIAGSDQIHLKVVVAEVQRDILKNLGINTEAVLSNTWVGAASSSGLGSSLVSGLLLNSDFTDNKLTITNPLSTFVQALNQQGVVRTLAEPTLTATSGESASFLAGGEFPIPVSSDDGQVTVEWKQFGIGLSFTPVVHTPGRISLRIKSEVSELTTEGAVEVNGISLKGLTVRRAESTVELPSGGSIVMAGLIKDNIRQQVGGFPGLMDVPILGSLFKSREYQRSQTELAIFVSPYIVDPVRTSALQRPDQNFAAPTDAQSLFLNQLNRIYRMPGTPPKGPYHGKVGFIYE